MRNSLLSMSVDFDEILLLMDEANEKTGPFPKEVSDFQDKASAILMANQIGGMTWASLIFLMTQDLFLSVALAYFLLNTQDMLASIFKGRFEVSLRKILTQYHRIMSENSSPIIRDSVTQILIEADLNNYDDEEVRKSIESLKSFFVQYDWEAQFTLASQKHPYIQAWIEPPKTESRK